jgi:hypothetical protein
MYHVTLNTIFSVVRLPFTRYHGPPSPSLTPSHRHVFLMRTVRTTTTPPLPLTSAALCLPLLCSSVPRCTLCRTSPSLPPSLVLNSRSFLLSPHACVWPGMWSRCLEVLLQSLIGSLLMFRWDDRSFPRFWCDLLLLEGGAELS